MTQGAVPPGWYPDPVEPGRHRWWDGVQWGQQAPAVPMPVMPAPAQPPQPFGQVGNILPTGQVPAGRTPQATSGFGAWRRATGRTRTAGHLILGGGIAIVLAAFLPWVTVFSVLSVSLPGDEVLVVLLIGAASAYLGVRVLQDRANMATRVGLLLLSAFDLLVTIGFFISLARDATEAVRPAIGFYAALLGLMATVAGTVVMHFASRD